MGSPLKANPDSLQSLASASTSTPSSSTSQARITTPPGHGPVTGHPSQSPGKAPYAQSGENAARTKRRALLEHIADKHWTAVPKALKTQAGGDVGVAEKLRILDEHVAGIDLNRKTLSFSWGDNRKFEVSNSQEAIVLYQAWGAAAETTASGAKALVPTLAHLKLAEAAKQPQPGTVKKFKHIEQAVPAFRQVEKRFADLVGAGSLFRNMTSGSASCPAGPALEQELQTARALHGAAAQLAEQLRNMTSGLKKSVDVPSPDANLASLIAGMHGSTRKMTGLDMLEQAEGIRDTCAVWPAVVDMLLRHPDAVNGSREFDAAYAGLEHRITSQDHAGVDAEVSRLVNLLRPLGKSCRQALDEMAGWPPQVQSRLSALKSLMLRGWKVHCLGMANLLQRRCEVIDDKAAQGGTPEERVALLKEKHDHLKAAIGFASRRQEAGKELVALAVDESLKKSRENRLKKDGAYLADLYLDAHMTSAALLKLLDSATTEDAQARQQVCEEMALHIDLALEHLPEPKDDKEAKHRSTLMQFAVVAHEKAFVHFSSLHMTLQESTAAVERKDPAYIKHITSRTGLLQKALAHIDKAISYRQSMTAGDKAGLAASLEHRLNVHFELRHAFVEEAQGWLNRLALQCAAQTVPADGDALLDAQWKAIEQAQSQLREAQGVFASMRVKTGGELVQEAVESVSKRIAEEQGITQVEVLVYYLSRYEILHLEESAAPPKLHRANSPQAENALRETALKAADKSLDVCKQQAARHPDSRAGIHFAHALLTDANLAAALARAGALHAKRMLPSWQRSQSAYLSATEEIFQRIDETVSNYTAYIGTAAPAMAPSRETREALSDFAARFADIAEDVAWLQQVCCGSGQGGQRQATPLQAHFERIQADLARAVSHIGTVLDLSADGNDASGAGQESTPGSQSARTIGSLTVIRTRFGGHVAGRILDDTRLEAVDRYGNSAGQFVRDEQGWRKAPIDPHPPEQEVEGDETRQPTGVREKQIGQKLSSGDEHREKAEKLAAEARALAALERSPEAIARKFDEADGHFAEAIRNYRWVADLDKDAAPATESGKAAATVENVAARRQACSNEAPTLVIDTIKTRARADESGPVLKCFDLRFLIEQGEIENVRCWFEESTWRDKKSPTAEFITGPDGAPLRTWIRKYAFDIKPGRHGPCAKFVAHFHYGTEAQARTSPASFRPGGGHLKRDAQENFGELARRAGIRTFRANLSEQTRSALDRLVGR